MQTKVSMVVPCYNKIEWVRPMFDSVLAQQWDNIELILVNDGSTDGTREVIAEYEPRFIARGYDVVIVDQENQGVAAAVKHGLERVTGEYVCMPDCDDVLHPEYVSAMTGVLDSHHSNQWVVCDSNETCFDNESRLLLKRNEKPFDNDKYPHKILEGYILLRTSQSIWRLMVRTSYLKFCFLPERFIVEPRVTQEPQIFIPLASGGAELLQLRRVLYYRYKRNGSILLNSLRSYDTRKSHVKEYLKIIEETCNYVMKDDIYKNILLSTGGIIREHMSMCLYQEYNEDHLLQRLVNIINFYTHANNGITLEMAYASGLFILSRHFSNKLIGYKPQYCTITPKAHGRIIAYAAYGNASCNIRRGLLNSNIRPCVFWDKTAKVGDSIDGIAVERPAFDTLRECDIILLLMLNNSMREIVVEQLQHTPARNNIWYFYDVANYLVHYYYE